ncbi:MAG: hypothetical protein QOF37_2329 [Thermoleophilaceae bacterium]|nr:hypothetical protein [Thermoleophilaceae bacterium]
MIAIALGVLMAAAPAGASTKHVLIGFIPTQPAPKVPLLFDLEQRDFAYGLTSPSIGSYSKRQMVLDMSSGTRIANRAYGHPLGRLELDYGPLGGRIVGWFYDNRRAETAPGEVFPGLLAQTVERAGRRVAYSGVIGFEQVEAVVAADRAGRLERVSMGTIGTFPARTTALLRNYDVVVARFPPDEAGLESLDRILAARSPGDLVYIVRAPPAGGTRLLPTGILGPAYRGDVLYSDTTRRVGLVAATDMPPTVLDYLGIPKPKQMQGQVIVARKDGGAEAVRQRISRLDVILGRRGPVIRTVALSILALLAVGWFARRREGLHWALRVSFLAVMWLPGVALVTAAIAPSRTAETIALALGSLALGAVTDRLVRWPLSAAVPAAIVFGAHAIDLLRGSPLIGASIAGPNPKGGSRFFGIGNELEILLAMEVLLGLGAALSLAPRRWVPRLFALGCLVAAVVIGSGRLGADVGGVITLGAGAAAAVLASLGGRPSRRAIVLACLVPVAGIAALIALDLLTGGGAHLTRIVVQGSGSGLLDTIQRRLTLSFRGLQDTTVLAICIIGAIAFVWGVRRRERIFASLQGNPAFMAGLWGGLFATVFGALGNDSGPVMFALGFLILLLATGYVRGGAPARAESEAPAGRRSAGSSTMPGCA